MTVASSIVQAAYREGNLIPAGKDPTTAEQTEALALLNSYMRGVLGYEMGENLADWLVPAPQRTAPVAANFPQLPYPASLDTALTLGAAGGGSSVYWYQFPPPNSRIVFAGDTAQTVYFPEAPNDGSRMALIPGDVTDDTVITLDGNGRTIEAAETKDVTAPFTAMQWFYRADLGDWTLVADVALTDDMPFPSELDDMFITALTIRLSPRYSKDVAPGTASTFQTMQKHFKARYRQAAVTIFGAQNVPNSYQSYPRHAWWGR